MRERIWAWVWSWLRLPALWREMLAATQQVHADLLLLLAEQRSAREMDRIAWHQLLLAMESDAQKNRETFQETLREFGEAVRRQLGDLATGFHATAQENLDGLHAFGERQTAMLATGAVASLDVLASAQRSLDVQHASLTDLEHTMGTVATSITQAHDRMVTISADIERSLRTYGTALLQSVQVLHQAAGAPLLTLEEALERSLLHPVLCACGHTMASFATDPESGVRTCLACYNTAKERERQSAAQQYRDRILGTIRTTEEALAQRRRQLEETADHPRNRVLREGVLADIRTLEITLAAEQARIGALEGAG